jgi:VWFA-related protein
MSRRVALAVLSFLCLVRVAAGQQPAASPSRQPIVSGATAIVVDAVIRDGKGNPVTDLRKEDFQLFEDGVQQEIGDLAVVAGAAPRRDERAAAPASGVSGSVPRLQVPSFNAIVFSSLSPEARVLAYKGALACLETLQPGDFVAVFAMDLSLTTLQPYTNDRKRVRKALDAAVRLGTWRSPPQLFSERATRVQSVPFEAPGQTRIPDIAEIQAATEKAWKRLDNLQQGYATTDALLAVAGGLSEVPGRKTVVLFSQGIPVPEQVLRHFRNVIAAANRANVSVYTIDAAGLRTTSEQTEAAANLTRNGMFGSAFVAEEMRTPTVALMLLAHETGGLFIENTNDLAAAFRRVDVDRRFYYLLTYTPKNTNFDGNWRAISVKVPNRRVTIRARTGYPATRAAGGVFAYEEPALAALDRSPGTTDIPLRAAALVFPSGVQSQIVVLAATAGSSIRFESDDKTHMYRTDFSILARIVDSSGHVIRKGSDPFVLRGPIQQMQQARGGQILFFRQPSLGAGKYTLEVAIHDALAGRSGVQRSEFVVPEAVPHTLQVSSLVVAERMERLKAEERDSTNPLHAGDVLVYPNLGEPIRKSQQKTIPFYVVVIPGSGVPPTAVLDVVKDGQTLAQVPVALPAANASGRIAHIAQLPTDGLPTGHYLLRLVVTQGDRREVRETAFEVAQ